MKTRAILKIRGDVQEAGYRAFIMRTAQKLKLVGYIENLTDGEVRIVCEGERKAIDEFSEKIRLKNDMVYVESVRRNFSKPKGEFKRFEVKTGDLAYEMFQGYATAGKHFNRLGQKIDCVGQKVEEVGQKVDNLTVHTDEHFNKLDEKYGIVSETLISMNKEQTRTREELTRAVDSLNTLVNSVNVLIKEHIEKEG
ncbi:MAG: acylphosphatase [Thermoplasmata archaeon]|nr:MAG: acylphosphatase [Thermoplasmata archaeon]